MQTIKEQNASIQDLVAASTASTEDMAAVVQELAGWRPRVEGAMNELRGEMGDLKAQVDQIVRNPALMVRPTYLPGLLPTSVKWLISEGGLSTLLKGDEALHRPDGHRLPTVDRGLIGWGFTPIDQTPDKGTLFDLTPTSVAQLNGEKGVQLEGMGISGGCVDGVEVYGTPYGGLVGVLPTGNAFCLVVAVVVTSQSSGFG
ncbi:hypothetical protein GUJ93_ZPchr0005g14720 [Zizania palustris]|uniref:Uncharacterized protein n=1 Tax=Zizania palustris TaxID=103762 RepID=A0A8J5SC59_ZIZPA|nr:hypothetical protein GUJ93_ZPchr0005g14720 [Zizania palustris]